MKPTIFITALAASALVALDARPAVAQSVAAAAQPSATASAAAVTWPAHPSGRYELEIALPDKVMPATIVVADSSGVPTAQLQTEGDDEAHPMKVTVKGTELFFNATAPRGAIEIVLVRTADLLSGRWSYGDGSGTLKGHVEKK